MKTSKRRDEIKDVIVSSLFEQGVLQKSEFGVAGVVPVVQTAGLTFEQQKELLAMQFEQEKLQLELRLRQQEVEKRLEVEKGRVGVKRENVSMATGQGECVLVTWRWTVRTPAIRSVLKQYESVLMALEEMASCSSPETSAKANGLHGTFLKGNTVLGLLMAEDLMGGGFGVPEHLPAA
ncbi:hypothetical protein NQZ68_002039 [Dissostichus eleginoides]|nr:hypothetical protein NQZ68_002039 [Dissostichus eleginoides]